jgi:hypothetical protein
MTCGRPFQCSTNTLRARLQFEATVWNSVSGYRRYSRLGFPKSHAHPVGPDCGRVFDLNSPSASATQSPSLLRYLRGLWPLSFRSDTTTRRLENVNMNSPRKHNKTAHHYVDPSVQLNTGLWTLFAGTTVFLALRIWIKITRRHGLWYDDHILLVTWVCFFFHTPPSISDN